MNIFLKPEVTSIFFRSKKDKAKAGVKSDTSDQEPEGLTLLVPDIQRTAEIVYAATTSLRQANQGKVCQCTLQKTVIAILLQTAYSGYSVNMTHLSEILIIKVKELIKPKYFLENTNKWIRPVIVVKGSESEKEKRVKVKKE